MRCPCTSTTHKAFPETAEVISTFDALPEINKDFEICNAKPIHRVNSSRQIRLFYSYSLILNDANAMVLNVFQQEIKKVYFSSKNKWRTWLTVTFIRIFIIHRAIDSITAINNHISPEHICDEWVDNIPLTLMESSWPAVS